MQEGTNIQTDIVVIHEYVGVWPGMGFKSPHSMPHFTQLDKSPPWKHTSPPNPFNHFKLQKVLR